MIIVILALLTIEIIAMAIFGIWHLIKLGKLEKMGIGLKQGKLERTGRFLSIFGTILVIILPEIFNIQNNYSFGGDVVFFLTNAIGFLLFIIGLDFRIAAHNEAEKNPLWIKWLLKLW